jgi:hypothetical protein
MATKKPAPAPAKKKPTPEEWFWALIDAHRDGEDYDLDGLVADLATKPKNDILDFGARLGKLLDQSYRGDLWGAAYLANGGCSDDAFDYFRGWLVSRGQKVFEAALANPDSIVDAVGAGEVELEELLYAAPRAWEKKTGKDDFYEHDEDDEDEEKEGEDEEEEAELDLSWSKDGEGIPEKLQKAYPRLWAKFGD